jgi:GNAT superfamily N-acetyltransferase
MSVDKKYISNEEFNKRLDEAKPRGRDFAQENEGKHHNAFYGINTAGLAVGRFKKSLKPTEAGEQGGRKYTKSQMDNQFIGKQAEERRDLTDGIRLAYRGWDKQDGKDEGRKLIILTRTADGAEIGRIDFDYEHLTKHGMKGRGFGDGDKDGIIVDGINVKVREAFQGKGYQHILYSEMFERARAIGATGFSQSIENKKGLPLKSVNRVIGEADNFIASLSEPDAQKPTQENFDRLMANAPTPTGDYTSNVPSVQNWGKLDKNARYKPSEDAMPLDNISWDEITSNLNDASLKAKKKEEEAGNVSKRYTPEQMKSEFVGRVSKENPKLTKGIRVEFVKKRSSKYGDEYEIRMLKKVPAIKGRDPSTYASEELIGSFTSEIDGNTASSGMAEIKPAFRNKGYGRLMYSEMAERLRELGARSWGGRMIDQKRRPQTLRETVIDRQNKKLGYQDSETRLSDERQDYNGDQTFYIESKLHGEAFYKPKEGWRDWNAEKTPLGSVIKNTVGYMIIMQNNKFRVYNPSKAMVGIYTDLDQAKRRVQKDEPK